jgi:thymidine kinase
MSISDDTLRSEYGHIILIEGSMFAGKTDELVSTLIRCKYYLDLEVIAFKSTRDVRNGNAEMIKQAEIIAHNGTKFPATWVNDTDAMSYMLNERFKTNKPYKIVGIDEGQFFDGKLIDFCVTQRDMGVTVLVSALLADSNAQQFKLYNSEKTICDLLIHADDIIHKKAVCACRQTALYSHLKENDAEAKKEGQVFVGGKSDYDAQCPRCFLPVQNMIKKYAGK